MKNITINQKEKLYKNLQNKKKYINHKKSVEINRKSNDYLYREQLIPNINDNSSNNKIKKIQNIFINNKTKLQYNNSSFFPSSITNKKSIMPINKIKNDLKLNEFNTSKNIFDNTFYNYSSLNKNKNSKYTLYLPNELTFYKKFDFNFPKSRDFNNKIPNLKYNNINLKLTPNKNRKQLKLKGNIEDKSFNLKEYSYMNEYNKNYINIYKPKTILNYKNEHAIMAHANELENNKKIFNKKQFSSINLSKKQLEKFLKTKVESSISIEYKGESFTNDSLQKVKKIKITNNINTIEHSSLIIPKLINNNPTPIEKKEEKNKSFKITKNINFNLYDNPKIIKIEKDTIPKIENNYNYDDFSKSISHDSFSRKINNLNLTKNVNFSINTNINSNKTIISILDEDKTKTKEINEQFYKPINNGNISKKSLKEIKGLKKNKIKFSNIIIPIKHENNNSFLNKIKNYRNKNFDYKKHIRKSKISLLINNKNNIDLKLSEQNDKFKSYISSNGNNLYSLKNNYIKINTQKKNKYNENYIELKQLSILLILLYLKTPFINKSFLDISCINYLTFNYSFSTIYIPIIDLTQKRKSIFMKGKLISLEKSTTSLFDYKKSKFIELKRTRSIFEHVSLNYIIKDLYSQNINSTNYIKDDFIYKPKLINNNNNNNMSNSQKKSNYFTRKSLRKLTYYSKFNQSKSLNNNLKHLSILQKGKLFYQSHKSVIGIKPINLKLQKRTAVNNENIYQRFSKDCAIKCLQLIKSAERKENTINILKNLIILGEGALFLEYFNKNSKFIDINDRDEKGNSFLILSVKYGLNNLSKMLIKKRININIQNKEGNTALHYALSSKNFDMADILRKSGAKENYVNKLGYTPWDCIGKNIELNEID